MKTFTDSYLTWVKTNTVETPLPNGWTEISTPFMDRHNDGLVIMQKRIVAKLFYRMTATSLATWSYMAYLSIGE